MKTKVILIIILITILVLVLLSSRNCEKWSQTLSAPDSPTGACYSTMEQCNTGCTGWRFINGTCASGSSCKPDEPCYGTQEGCMGNNVVGYRCSENCTQGAVCGPGDDWNNCFGSRENCLASCTGYVCSTSASGCTASAKCTSTSIGTTCWTKCPDTCVGYRYLNNQCIAGAKCTAGEVGCYPTEALCKSSPSSVSYKSIGSRCFISGYNCEKPIQVGSPVKYTLPFVAPSSSTGGIYSQTDKDVVTVYGTVVKITNDTASIMPDVITTTGPTMGTKLAENGMPGNTYYWGRNTWFTKNRMTPEDTKRWYGTYGNSTFTLPTDPQLAPLANAPLSALTLANIPDVLL